MRSSVLRERLLLETPDSNRECPSWYLDRAAWHAGLNHVELKYNNRFIVGRRKLVWTVAALGGLAACILVELSEG